MKSKPVTEQAELWPEQSCMVCKRTVAIYYARYQHNVVCSRKCMEEKDKLDRFPGHSAEDFERRNP